MTIIPFNIATTLIVNFKLLPFRQAIKFPIIVYHRTRIIHCTGIAKFENVKVEFKMVQIGAHGSDMFSNQSTTIDVRGVIIFRGSHIRIGHGTLFRVESNAIVEFYENSIIGANNIIFCCHSIKFHKNSLFSWNCQIMDSDTHHLINTATGEANEITKEVIIGEDTWIGNHVIINKGTKLPCGTTVSSFSLCNKDYSKIIEPYSIIGGIPAKLLKTNMHRKSYRASFMDKT